MANLKFKGGAESVPLTEDFYYMINGGGWCAPEKFLEESDAKRVREALELIKQYELEGIEGGFFEEV